MLRIISLAIGLLITLQSLSQSDSLSMTFDININLMKTTFEIVGENGTCGTGFLILKKSKIYPGKYTSSDVVFVTAAHVLDSIKGNFAYLLLRENNGSYFKTTPYRIQIRDGHLSFYKKHLSMDVAALYITLPSTFNYDDILNETWLAKDADLLDYKVQTGETINCLGYPLCITDSIGNFPILRSGKIASYPLVPSTIYKTFLYDFEIYAGNSGGPVYFFEDGTKSRSIGKNQFKMGGRNVQFIMGIVVQQKGALVPDPLTGTTKNVFLKIGVVIQAPFILETINLL